MQLNGVILFCLLILNFNFNSLQVMCDAYTPAGEPIPTNKRHAAAKIFRHPNVVAEEPWYGIVLLLIVNCK